MPRKKIPVVMLKGDSVEKYYDDYLLTEKDGFKPNRVLEVCSKRYKTHKNKRFNFASKSDIEAYKILKGCLKRR